MDTYRKPDGSAYLSGTEWEYQDASNASPRPAIRVYRRMDIPPIQRDDPDGRNKHDQWDKVDGLLQAVQQHGRFRAGRLPAIQRARRLPDEADPRSGAYRRAAFGRGIGNAFPRHNTRHRRDRPAAPLLRAGRRRGRPGHGTDRTRAGSAAGARAGRHRQDHAHPQGRDRRSGRRPVGARRWFVELETANHAATLRIAIVQAIGRNPAATTFAEALAWLAQQPGLLVLDNLETPWEQDQRAVQDSLQMLAATPGLSLVCSLRGAAAPPSPRWTRPPTILRPLPEDETRRLFLELAPGIAADDPHLALFLRALGGVPLAVELVALRAAGTARCASCGGVGRRGMVLAAHPDLPPDHRLTSLTRSLDLSWHSRRLRDDGRLLFRLLGQLPAGIAEADRAALLGDAAAEAGRQLRAVGLAFERDGRLDLLPPVREYARTQFPPTTEDKDRSCRYYLDLLQQRGAALGLAGGAEAVARLAPELANFDKAFAELIDYPRRTVALRFHSRIRLAIGSFRTRCAWPVICAGRRLSCRQRHSRRGGVPLPHRPGHLLSL